MMEINGGYIALAIVGVVFFCLQFWWISMTIRNGSDRGVFASQRQQKLDERKKLLERIFFK